MGIKNRLRHCASAALKVVSTKRPATFQTMRTLIRQEALEVTFSAK
jgi:hypothetical protein